MGALGGQRPPGLSEEVPVGPPIVTYPAPTPSKQAPCSLGPTPADGGLQRGGSGASWSLCMLGLPWVSPGAQEGTATEGRGERRGNRHL